MFHLRFNGAFGVFSNRAVDSTHGKRKRVCDPTEVEFRFDAEPVVSLGSTTGYFLAGLRAAFVWSVIFCATCLFAAAEGPRQRLSADFGWRFNKGDMPGAEQASFDDAAWRKLDLPHDWSIEGPYTQDDPTGGGGGSLPTGIGWYRRSFFAPQGWQGKKVFVEFDGVYQNSDVWINGELLGHRPFGYISFEYDLTVHLKLGQTNLIAVRVDNSHQPNSRWYSGSGIYRHVWVTVTDPVHVAQWGTYVTTPSITNGTATVRVRTQLQNDSSGVRDVTLATEILNAQGVVVASGEEKKSVAAGARQEADSTLNVPGAALWSLESPTLYSVRSVVKNGADAMDEVITPFGIREIKYDVVKGFLLNGKQVKMQGMCIHHEAGAVGAAVPIGVWERRLQLLKDMGCNAIRLSHNPPAPELLDLLDRMGFLVMDESFDEWKSGKVAQGYAKYFDEWSQRDLTDMLHRDRNHPSIVIWSVGNEIGEQTRPDGAAILRPLVETCHREDPTRPVTAACDNVFTDRASATPEFLNLLDVVGYNYVDRWGDRRETMYDDDRHAFPQRKVIGTESAVVGSRGDYALGGARLGGGGIGGGGRGLGGGGPRPASYLQGMIRAEQLWKFIKDHDYVTGDFGWTGIDYLGESRWPSKSSSSGMLTTGGFPKDNYYFYQSQWTTNAMIHLFPNWNWAGQEGKVIPVVCYTSCDTVELFLNDRSFGVKTLEFPRQGTAGGWNSYARPNQPTGTTADLHLTWDVPYEAGTLKAVGYKLGRQVCTEEIRTAGAAVTVTLVADRTNIMSDARDVAHFTVKILDEHGEVVPGATNLVTFDLQGAAKLIGVDNGNPVSHEDYKAPRRQVFHGLALAIVQSTRETGVVRITARAEGLKESTVELTARAPAMAEPVLP